MAKLILGITGEMVSGKGTITKHLMGEYGANSYRFSTILRDILDRLYLEYSRENLANLSTVLRKTFGEDILAKVIFEDANTDEHEVVVIDGIRRMDDIKYLKTLPHFKFMYVEADMETRYERILRRDENADDRTKTFESFQKDHEHEAELQIKDLKNYADYVVDNHGTFQQLYAQVDKIVKDNLG